MGSIVVEPIRNPRVLLLYAALQFAPEEVAKPDGSLSLVYLAGALRKAGYEVRILDCAVGEDGAPLPDTFFRSERLPSGLIRVGMSDERIAGIADSYDIFGISSIFTPQTSMVLALIRLLKQRHPNRLVVCGGGNARWLLQRFFDAGADLIAMSEAESTIVQIADAVRNGRTLTEIGGIAFRSADGKVSITPPPPVLGDLDMLPMPAWDLLPLKQYWSISRPHGGDFPRGQIIRYASLQTSRGCPFQCQYCHISMENEGSASGPIARFRVKSIDRVLRELDTLRSLGVEHVYLEDDSLFAKKPRALEMFRLIREMGLNLLDVNGINICHLQKNEGGRLRPDLKFFEILSAAGLRFLSLPFESANQRLLDTYASSKWSLAKTDVPAMLSALARAGIHASGNYMIGYPDETVAEIYKTITMARRHVELGLDYALFFTVVPFPGSLLYERALRRGQIDAVFDPDSMRWTKSILKDLCMSADALEHVRQVAWLTVNRADYVEYKTNMWINAPSSRTSP
jgi:anaerobic magnesium-protoporphyrin IX monomethyl ester cyclase